MTQAASRLRLADVPLTGTVSVAARPILRWAGGKQHIIGEILQRFRGPDNSGKYVEPFLGAASVFLAVTPSFALLSDLNYQLIDCYEQLVRNPERVVSELATLRSTTKGAAGYYSIRKLYNQSRPSARQAARFIYLNKTCFNGIFRVNRQGEFNVPFGRKYVPALPTRSELIAAAGALKHASIQRTGYEQTLSSVHRGDSVFFDPPYPPSSRTAYFAHYTTSRFSEFDQHRLAAMIKDLDQGGVRFMMTNADCPLIRRLYGQYCHASISVTRWVSCKALKPIAKELIITNY